MSELVTPNGVIAIDCEPGQVSDGYHTFDELYRHRCLLWAVICSQRAHSFKTRKNDSGEEWPGWFIAGFNTTDGQITYHLPDELWGLVNAREIERNAGYDGHTSQDVAQRLELMLKSGLR